MQSLDFLKDLDGGRTFRYSIEEGNLFLHGESAGSGSLCCRLGPPYLPKCECKSDNSYEQADGADHACCFRLR